MIKTLIAMMLFFPMLGFAKSILVFTDEMHPINDRDNQATICQIIDTSQLMNKINNELSHSKTTNKIAIAHRYEMDFKKIEKSYLCLNQAKELGVTKLPTIILGDKYIVGLTDVSAAVNKYENNND